MIPMCFPFRESLNIIIFLQLCLLPASSNWRLYLFLSSHTLSVHFFLGFLFCLLCNGCHVVSTLWILFCSFRLSWLYCANNFYPVSSISISLTFIMYPIALFLTVCSWSMFLLCIALYFQELSCRSVLFYLFHSYSIKYILTFHILLLFFYSTSHCSLATYILFLISLHLFLILLKITFDIIISYLLIGKFC